MIKNFIFKFAVQTLIFFVLFEVGIRLFFSESVGDLHVQEKREYKNLEGQAYGYAGPCQIGLCPRVGNWKVKKTISKSDADDFGELVYEVTYTIDKRFRRVNRVFSGPFSGIGINVFGGSFAYGEGLDEDETLPFFLARQFAGAEVKNLAFHGAGVPRALLLLDTLDGIQGDINILVTGAYHGLRADCAYPWVKHDFRLDINVLADDTRSAIVSRCAESPSRSWLLLADTALKKIPFVQHAYLTQLLSKYLTDSYSRYQITLYKELVLSFVQKSQDAGAYPVIAYIPWSAAHNFFSAGYYRDPIPSFFENNSIDFVELNHFMLPGHQIHKYDQHPNFFSNCKTAEALAARLSSVPRLSCSKFNENSELGFR